MVFKNWGIYGFLGPSWVLITYNICPPVIVPLSNCAHYWGGRNYLEFERDFFYTSTYS